MECCCEFCCSKPTLKKRLGIAKVVSYAQIVAATIYVIWYAFVENTEVECRVDHSTDRNATKICYECVKKETYPVLLKLGFGLLGVIFATLMSRLAHLFEELCHCKSRYDGNCCRVLKACFSGIKKIIAVVVVVCIAIGVPLSKHATADYKDYFMYILGGMGVNALISDLLDLNSQPEAQISDYLEQTGIHVVWWKTRVRGYADMRVCGYAGMRICGYADMRICGYAGMRICGYADMRVCGYADMRVCGYVQLV